MEVTEPKLVPDVTGKEEGIMEEETTEETHTIHYNRTEEDYDNWDVHIWNTGVNETDYLFTHYDDYGYVLELEVAHGSEVGDILRKIDWSDKNHESDQKVIVDGIWKFGCNKGKMVSTLLLQMD